MRCLLVRSVFLARAYATDALSKDRGRAEAGHENTIGARVHKTCAPHVIV